MYLSLAVALATWYNIKKINKFEISGKEEAVWP